MALAFRAQRTLTATFAIAAVVIATFSGSPLIGLWFAAWIVALACGGLGPLVCAYLVERPGPIRFTPTDRKSGHRVVSSGYGYLAAVTVASVLPTIASVALLMAVLADFAANHHVANAPDRCPARTVRSST